MRSKSPEQRLAFARRERGQVVPSAFWRLSDKQKAEAFAAARRAINEWQARSSAEAKAKRMKENHGVIEAVRRQLDQLAIQGGNAQQSTRPASGTAREASGRSADKAGPMVQATQARD